ncbi:MAG TPA: hypothetical protein DGB32_03075 [Dehalococcoidia bacterium]|nr:hypothetical protein [Dehalococcoidia bacterium]
MKKCESRAVQMAVVTLRERAWPAVVYLIPRFMNMICTVNNSPSRINGLNSARWTRRSAFV